MMRLSRKNVVLLASLVASQSLFPLGAMAQTAVYPVQISEVTTGWGDDTIGVVPDKPVVNPAKCPRTEQYLSNAGDPGNRSYFAAALTAFANKVPVTIVVSNTQCDQGFPRIMAVSLSR